jgi:hypothetical protein
LCYKSSSGTDEVNEGFQQDGGRRWPARAYLASEGIAEVSMSRLDYKEMLEMLGRSGFTSSEIRRLQKFYRGYAANAMDEAAPDLHRLEFVRWLVTTHRLTDQIELKSNVCHEPQP